MSLEIKNCNKYIYLLYQFPSVSDIKFDSPIYDILGTRSVAISYYSKFYDKRISMHYYFNRYNSLLATMKQSIRNYYGKTYNQSIK